MRALIMAGGEGSRLGRGEKPLALICGKPMVSFITGAFRSAGCEPVVVVSSRTPMTANWCRAHGIAIVRTAGRGYIEDMVTAVRALEEDHALIVSVSDIPCITQEIVRAIVNAYGDCGTDALSAWIPARHVQSCCRSMPYKELVGGVEACPAGVNILHGDRIDTEQEEFALLLDEPALALNVNTSGDRARAEAFLMAGTPH
jgi:adenosylcobinamide-phosphate guanylyltransferase